MTALLVSGATCLVTLGGGLLVLRLQAYRGLVLAFCAGALVAGALMDVIPDALQMLESTQTSWHHHHLLFACSLGFLVFYLFEHGAHHAAEHDAGEERDHPAHYNHSCQVGAWGAIGISVHSLFDGVAIGSAFQAGEDIGWVVTAAVLLHKLADGASTVGVMLGTLHSTRATTLMLIITALAPLVGTLLQSLVTIPAPMLALALGWFAGVFLYLGASSLLPTAHEAGHSRWLPLATLSGVAFVFLVQRIAE